MTDCQHLLQQRIADILRTTLSLHRATVTDGVLKLGYTSVIFVDLGVKVDGAYCCDCKLTPTIQYGTEMKATQFGVKRSKVKVTLE